MTALSPADDSGTMSSGEAEEDEEPIGLVDGHGLIFLQSTRSRASTEIQRLPIQLLKYQSSVDRSCTRRSRGRRRTRAYRGRAAASGTPRREWTPRAGEAGWPALPGPPRLAADERRRDGGEDLHRPSWRRGRCRWLR
jgi:hypothetical protein